MKQRLIGLITAMVLCFWCGSVLAVDQSACGDFSHHWGNNVSCDGLLEYSDMFNEDGTLTAEFQTILSGAATGPAGMTYNSVWSPFLPEDVVSGGAADAQIWNNQVDNRRKANGDFDSRFKFSIIKGGTYIPQVWQMTVAQPGDDCTPDEDWHFNVPDERGCPGGQLPDDQIHYPNIAENYPVRIYHIDSAKSG